MTICVVEESEIMTPQLLVKQKATTQERVFKHRTLEETLAAQRAKREEDDRASLMRVAKIVGGLLK